MKRVGSQADSHPAQTWKQIESKCCAEQSDETWHVRLLYCDGCTNRCVFCRRWGIGRRDREPCDLRAASALRRRTCLDVQVHGQVLPRQGEDDRAGSFTADRRRATNRYPCHSRIGSLSGEVLRRPPGAPELRPSHQQRYSAVSCSFSHQG